MSLLSRSCVMPKNMASLLRLTGYYGSQSYRKESLNQSHGPCIVTPCACYATNSTVLRGQTHPKRTYVTMFRSYSTKTHSNQERESSVSFSQEIPLKKSTLLEVLETDTGEEELEKINVQAYADSKFDGFYYLPQIPLVRLVCRMKLYQTILTVGLVPGFVGMMGMGLVTMATCAQVTGLAAFAMAMLYAMTFYTSRLVGWMGLSEDGRVVKMSHLTFWGKRNDTLIPVKDILPLAVLKGGPQLLKLETKLSDDHFYFSTRYGKTKDMDKFTHVFGST